MKKLISLSGLFALLLSQMGYAGSLSPEEENTSLPSARGTDLQESDGQQTRSEKSTLPQQSKVEIAEYELSLTMHPLYPIEPFFSVLYLDEKDEQVAELPLNSDKGWTYKTPSHFSFAQRPFPRKLDMVYYSVVEGKNYSLQAPLPTEKFEELFAQKTADGEPLYEAITFGAAPYGQVAVWVQRADNKQVRMLDWLKGKEVEVPFDQFKVFPHSADGENWQQFRENVLQRKTKAADNLKKNGLPDKNLFEQFNNKYNLRISVVFAQGPKNGVKPIKLKLDTLSLQYFNGEEDHFADADKVDPRAEKGYPYSIFSDGPALRAKPKEIQIDFRDGKNTNTSYLYVPYQTSVDNRAIHEVFEQAFGGNPGTPGELTFTFNGPSQPWSVTLTVGTKRVELPLEEIRFRNHSEAYRSPKYYQPESHWKGQPPVEEAKAKE